MVTFEIIKELERISETAGTVKQLTLTSWNGNPAKLDLRTWRTEGGKLIPNKGITLTEDEARALTRALTAYFKSETN